MLLIGIHEGFHTTRNSFSPETDERSARIACTSQRKPSLEELDGAGEAADGEYDIGVLFYCDPCVYRCMVKIACTRMAAAARPCS